MPSRTLSLATRPLSIAAAVEDVADDDGGLGGALSSVLKPDIHPVDGAAVGALSTEVDALAGVLGVLVA